METKKAVVVGVNDYPFAPLENARNDGDQISNILQMPEYKFEVALLLDKDATRRTIIEKLRNLCTSSGTLKLFYFAGHGFVDKFGSTYIIPIDSDEIDVGIDIDTITKLVRACSDPMIVILDCCHAGSAAIRSMTNRELRPVDPDDLNLNILNWGSGKVLLAACQPTEYAYELPSLNHGLFTYHLLQGLLGEASDVHGSITALGLHDYVAHKFREQTRQLPVFKGDIIGTIVIGEGLSPREQQIIPEDVSLRIEESAQNLVNEYLRSSTVTNIEIWRQTGYREACDLLYPRLQWFENQLTKYPQLQNAAHFRTAYSTMQNKLADLGRLMDGMNTKHGVVQGKIGSGTFGTVWHVLTADGRNIAYKVYHPVDLDNLEKLKRFKRGYDAMKHLDHPHIVRVHEFTSCPHGFLMDFIQGQNLRNFAFANLSPSEIIQYLLIVGETLQHAHHRGVIHRDVKPENIIIRYSQELGSPSRPYLTDFDLAWFTTATQFTREGIGSLAYASPEQLQSPNSRVSHKPTTDIYAFGQLIYYFVCRQDPAQFTSDSSRAIRERLQQWVYEEPARKMSDSSIRCAPRCALRIGPRLQRNLR